MDLDAVTAHVAGRVRADAVDPLVIRFLLSRYAATGRADLAAIVGEALASASTRPVDAAPAADGPEWLLLFRDALAWSDDERVRTAAERSLRVFDGLPLDAAAIDACLGAAAALGDADRVARRVDDLERLIGRRYEPGAGVGADDAFATASALLTAYDVTARVPYPMLAEELVRTAQRSGWNDGELTAACAAARVLCRLQALHRDEEYVAAAVIAADADYDGDAGRLLARHAPHALDAPRDAAAYGLALAQWLGLH